MPESIITEERVIVSDGTIGPERARSSDSNQSAERAILPERTKARERPKWLNQFINRLVTTPEQRRKARMERALQTVIEFYENKTRKTE